MTVVVMVVVVGDTAMVEEEEVEVEAGSVDEVSSVHFQYMR